MTWSVQFDIRALFEPEYLNAPVRRRGGQRLVHDAVTVLVGMRDMLAEMAADNLTPAEIAHAERYLADEPTTRIIRVQSSARPRQAAGQP